MYGTERYGTNEYSEEIKIPDEELKPYKPDLLKYISPFLREASVFKNSDEAMSYELGVLALEEDAILKEFFVDTATFGLSHFENEYGIQTDLNKTYEDRREIIKAKMRGSGTTSLSMIKNVSEAFSGGEVNVIEHPESYSFTIQFIGILGIPKNLEAFKETLENIKPAHLAYDFKYTYTVWSFLEDKKLTWSQAEASTWDKLKIYDD